MEIINMINNFAVIISFAVNILFIFPRIYSYCTKKRYIKKVLGFRNETVRLSHGIFLLTTDINITNNFITYNSLKSINNLINLFNAVNQKFDLLGTGFNTKNEINIGGMVMNKKVNAYFSKHFQNFIYVTDKKYEEKYSNYPIDTSMLQYSDNKFGFLIDNNEFLEIKYGYTDYAFIIKMDKSDFKDGQKKTVHILFGAGDIATNKASEYLLTHCKQIYRKFGNKHYFFAVEINLIDESFNDSKGIIDLTDKMFK